VDNTQNEYIVVEDMFDKIVLKVVVLLLEQQYMVHIYFVVFVVSVEDMVEIVNMVVAEDMAEDYIHNRIQIMVLDKLVVFVFHQLLLRFVVVVVVLQFVFSYNNKHMIHKL